MTEAHTERSHAKLSPSSASRWLKCPGSVRLSEGIEETPSVFAAEGTAAHMLAEMCLRSGRDSMEYVGKLAIDINSTAGPIQKTEVDGKTVFAVTAEMAEAVQVFLDEARRVMEGAADVKVEERLDMSAFVPGMFGTGDLVAYSETHRRVTVIDLKMGKGVVVEVAENLQLLTYALGAAQRLHNRGVEEIEIILVQPRAPHKDGPVRRWVTDIVGLHEHAIALQNAAKAAGSDDAAFAPGDWCKFCKAAGICSALRTEVDRIIGANRIGDTLMGVSDPAAVPFKDWKLEAAELNLVANWLKRREEFAHTEALRGNLPPGAKLVGKRPTRQWRDPAAAVARLSLMLDEDALYENKLRSPAQIEKELPKAERGIIATLAESRSSGTVLAPLDDPRPAVEVYDASGFEPMEVGD